MTESHCDLDGNTGWVNGAGTVRRDLSPREAIYAV